jgi:hypothetical protein
MNFIHMPMDQIKKTAHSSVILVDYTVNLTFFQQVICRQRQPMSIIEPQFIISEDILTKCLDFAKNSVNTSKDKYARRNQFDVEKIVKDIRNGKVGEEAVYEKVSALYPALSKPDHQIYSKKDKSWSPDLIDSATGTHLAVKSQDIESAINFGESWVFQFNQNKNYDRDTGIFNNTNDKHYVVFVALNVPKRVGSIRAIVKVQWLHDNNLFKPMKKQILQNNKLAVYMDDLEKHKEELWQL